MSANVVHVIFNQESMYANLSSVPQTRVNVCHKQESMSVHAGHLHMLGFQFHMLGIK